MTQVNASVELRPKLVGARIKRTEDPRLLSGNGRYVDDITPKGTLHVALCRSDQPHATIRSIALGDVFDVPGVVAVFDASDLEPDLSPAIPTSKMKNYYATPIWPLARGKVRYVGEPVIAVVADSRYAAEDAVERIVIEYEPLPFAIRQVDAAAPDAPLLHEEAGTNVIVSREFQRGEVDEVFAQAHLTVRARFRMTRKTAVAMETRSYLAEWGRRKQALTLHSSTNIPGIIRDVLSRCLDLPGNRMRVVAPDVGGSFGGKGSLYHEELLVCVLARKLDRPIKFVSDRLEDLTATSQAFDELIDAELAVDEEGHLLGLRADVIGDIGAYSIYPWTGALEPVQVVSFLPGPYRMTAYRGRVRGVLTPKPPTGPYRGVGRPSSTFAMERLVDMAARKLKLDPADIRRRNLVNADEFPYRTGSGIIWDRSAFQECLQAACDHADYPALVRERDKARAQGRLVGIGFASYAELTGIGSRIAVAPGMPINTGVETAKITIDATGAITADFGISSHGQGLETTLAQVIADELGCRMEDIEVRHGDSALVPMGTGTYASRSAVLAGGAATKSSHVVKAKVLKAAAHLMEVPVEDLEASQGVVRSRSSNRTLTFKEIAHAVYAEMGRIPHDQREDLVATQSYDPYFGTACSSTHLAMVEIDPETFGVTVKRFVVAEDCGRIINPMIVDGQVHGAVAQGIGAALLEEVVHDDHGQCVTASLADYLAPVASIIPPIGIVHVEAELPDTIGGFRGMGEGGTIGAPAAIANAVSDALSPLGIEIDTLPVTPDRIFRLVEAARAKNPPERTNI
ncbi:MULTISPECIES: xanthine dehydrogenase family protein molybdopterin-binding subunit [unclassified Chelatococcus]|uniref:xanthine dehydrogenase family protein molybdopterin-binding subunit n=2 Tax=Chelatococcus TaxID=28209 RepID=UPI001BD0E71A|nr:MULTISPECIES: xanthine dehydrogenase family protein molybdopterin-binding subunit [unclassified Chelatococcus]CAH1653171.1 Xanthine dehydrogenase family protein [Hyphomicrobiales bacterium]MBS7742936.1 xanthine dehydrogenase family protein [Chelatococcus sp. HY11]MBX3541946.1 xanthine dehydrogenase family protein [Chelatococcus sp.]MCO5074163.1 xanthine dehydrogenase family protein molybdopterin-binding subunit [Chelatococcus sp.]CAH1694268.1 Xanthine dehydrogenase family protein [Hyphomicr